MENNVIYIKFLTHAKQTRKCNVQQSIMIIGKVEVCCCSPIHTYRLNLLSSSD